MPGSTPPADTISGLQHLAKNTDETRGAAEAVRDLFERIQTQGFVGPVLDVVREAMEERSEAHRRAAERERAFLAGELAIPHPVPSPDQVGAYRGMRMFTDGP